MRTELTPFSLALNYDPLLWLKRHNWTGPVCRLWITIMIPRRLLNTGRGQCGWNYPRSGCAHAIVNNQRHRTHSGNWISKFGNLSHVLERLELHWVFVMWGFSRESIQELRGNFVFLVNVNWPAGSLIKARSHCGGNDRFFIILMSSWNRFCI